MYPRILLFVLALGLLALSGLDSVVGQDTIKKITSDSPQPGIVEVRFTDGGNLRMTIAENSLDFVTAHGKLKIAVSDIRRLDLATRLSEAHQRLIDESIANLGSAQFKLREKATVDLLGLKEKAYPAVLKAALSKDTEVAKRAKEILESIREKVPAQRLRFREKDIVHTSDSTISGKLELASLNVTTQQFGTVQMKLADVAGMYFINGGAEVELKMDGRYALANEVWFDTGIDVTEHVRLTITATGEIDMYATGGYDGQYVGTPKGKKAWPGNTGLPLEPGTLVGRIGESGKVFVVKDQFEEPAPGSGRLYLRAAGNTYSVQTKGEYTIKIAGGVPAIGGPKVEAPPTPIPDTPLKKDGR